jgi:hypothetical protein
MQPPIQWVPGALSPGIMRPGRKSYRSLPFRAEVKNAWSYTSTPSNFFMAWCLVKHGDKILFQGKLSIPDNRSVSRLNKSRDSSVGIALGYGLDDRGSTVRFPAEAENFSLHHRVQNGSGAHPASYPMGTGGSLPGGKAAGAWSWPLTSI